MTGLEPMVIAQIAGAAMSAIGQIQQGNAAKQAASFNAAIASNNAIASRQKATADAARQERESRLRAGAVGAARGASGGTAAGSALDLMESNAAQEELDRLTILHGGDLQAAGFESDAAVQRMRGSAAQKAGRLGAASTLLIGGARASGSFGGGSGAAANSGKGSAHNFFGDASIN